MRVSKLKYVRSLNESDWCARMALGNGYQVELLTPSPERALACYTVIVLAEHGSTVAQPGESLEAVVNVSEEEAEAFLSELAARPPR